MIIGFSGFSQAPIRCAFVDLILWSWEPDWHFVCTTWQVLEIYLYFNRGWKDWNGALSLPPPISPPPFHLEQRCFKELVWKSCSNYSDSLKRREGKKIWVRTFKQVLLKLTLGFCNGLKPGGFPVDRKVLKEMWQLLQEGGSWDFRLKEQFMPYIST